LGQENAMDRISEKPEITRVPETRPTTNGRKTVVSPAVQTPSEPSRTYPGPERTARFSSIDARGAVLSHELSNSLTVISSALQFIDSELGKSRLCDPALMITIE